MATQQSVIDFPPPPKVTGNAAADLSVLVEYLWSFYRQAILSGGLIQNSELGAQLKSQFLLLYNLGVLSGSMADRVPYFTDANEWALANFTDTGRALVAKTSVAEVLAMLGVTNYTDEMARDAIAALIHDGTGITWAYNDGADTLIPTVTITQYTDAMADARAALMTMTSYTVAGVPDPTTNPRRMIYVSNESGGAVPAFSDGTNWRRVTDRAVVS